MNTELSIREVKEIFLDKSTEQNVLKEYQKLINDIDTSIMFIENDIKYTMDPKSHSPRFCTISNEKELMQAYCTLTCGFDESFIEFIKDNSTREKSNFEIQADSAEMGKSVRDIMVDTTIISREVEEPAVSEMILQINEISKIMDDLKIDKSDIAQSVNDKFKASMVEENVVEINSDAMEKYYEQKREEEPAEVVESNDGYVMATSKVTAANQSAIYSKITNGNEIANSLPAETTTDASAVKAKVKLETTKAVGSKEKAQIDAGMGTDADIEALSEGSSSYEAQTDRGSNKSSKERGGLEI